MHAASPAPSIAVAARRTRRLLTSFLAAALLGAAAPLPSLAADREATLAIRDHRFDPTELRVPANERVRLTIHNQDDTPEEFESHSLNREKLIPGGAKAVVYIGPLKPGRYEFFGEYHEATAKGAVIAE
jgi:hypothetical protein